MKILRAAGALTGYELNFIANPCVELYDDGLIDIGVSCSPARAAKASEYSSHVVMPPLCNGHIHVLDYLIMDRGEELDISRLVSLPSGFKYRMMLRKSRQELYEAAAAALSEAVRTGTLYFASYAELGSAGAQIVNDAIHAVGAYGVVLAQPLSKRLAEYLELGRLYRGLGLDTIFDVTGSELRVLATHSHIWHVQVHVSETYDLYLKRDYELLPELKPRAMVHGTYLGSEEAEILQELESTWWVLCPRSNMLFTGKLPPLDTVYRLWARKGFNRIALGTDNAGWVPPFIHEEIRYAYISGVRGIDNPDGYAKMLLYAATYSCTEMIGIVQTEPLEAGSKIPAVLVMPVEGLGYCANPHRCIAKRLGSIGEPLLLVYNGRRWGPIGGKER